MKKAHSSPAPIGNVNLAAILRRSQRSGVPKYVVLREALLGLIKAGHWKPGDKFPTEDELRSATPYSLGTIQRALRCLVELRILIRRQGSGSFVADLPRRLDHSRHCKFIDETGMEFLPIYSKATKRTIIKETGPWSRFLGPAKSGYIRVNRRIGINNDFIIAGRFYCDAAVLPYLNDCPLDELSGANFVALILSRCNIHIKTLGSYVTVMNFSKEICAEMGIKPSQSGMFVQATARTADEQYVYYQEFYIPKVSRPLYFSEDVAFVPERHLPL